MNTLVYDLSVEIETKVEAYLHIPVGFVKVMALFYGEGMLPSGLLNAGCRKGPGGCCNDRNAAGVPRILCA